MAQEYLSAQDFVTALEGKTVDFDTGKGLVKLRGLSVSEVKEMKAAQVEGASGVDSLPLLVSRGLAEPRLTEDAVNTLAAGAFDLVNEMAQRIMELSGITDNAKKREALDS
jgi:hypothetical protein